MNSVKAEYLVVGGHALAYYGAPRFTADIDVFISKKTRNAEKVLRVIRTFGFASLPLAVGDFTAADRVYQFGYPPWRIDILTGLSGVRFETAWKAKVRVRYGRTPIWLVSRGDLVRNKRRTGRPQDIADLDALGVPLTSNKRKTKTRRK